MTPTEKARRSDALYHDCASVNRRVLCDMVANREEEIEALREFCHDMYQRLQWADVIMGGGALDARIMRRARDLGVET